MPSTKDFYRRFEILDECLRCRKKKLPVEVLVENHNKKQSTQFNKKLTIRTLYNDLKYLQYELDAPVEKITADRVVHYRYFGPNFSIKNLQIRQVEVARLKDGIDYSSSYSSISTVQITNNTGFDLTVRYSELDVEMIVVPVGGSYTNYKASKYLHGDYANLLYYYN